MAVDWEKKFLGIRLAHEGMMLDDAQKLLTQQRALVKAHGAEHFPGSTDAAEDDNMIHVGDATIHNNHQAPQGMGGIGKLLAGAAIGVGLLATGGAGALGLAALLKPAAAIVVPAAPLDVEIPWEWKDGKMNFGKPRQTVLDVTIPGKRN
jgi:hypothetical protein